MIVLYAIFGVLTWICLAAIWKGITTDGEDENRKWG